MKEKPGMTKPAKIAEIIELMEETQTDIMGVMEYLILDEKDGFNREDDAILSWFPDEILTQVHQWLEKEAAEQDQDSEDEDEEL